MSQNISDNKFNLLSTREGFNLSLRHFKKALSFSAAVEDGENLADVLFDAVQEGTLSPEQIRPVLNILLADKFNYSFKSFNLSCSIDNVSEIIDVTSQWTALDIVVASYDSSGNLSLINPSHLEHWTPLLPLKKDELVVFYLKVKDEKNLKIEEKALEDLLGLFNGKKIKTKKAYVNPVLQNKNSVPNQQEVRKETPSVETNYSNISTKYSVQVTNELFHNGNVEAWKKIIASYKAKHPGLDVLLWYDGERINDINTLFKWGKVKHGNPIMFSVAGDNIKNVSKLKKYLFEGASPRFKLFLRGAVNSVLDLF